MSEAATLAPNAQNTSEQTERRPPTEVYALKEGDSFVVADAYGDINGEGDGLFHFDTRLLSEFRLTFGQTHPSLLSSAVSRDNVHFTSHVTNKPLPVLGGGSTPQGVLHVERSRLLWRDRLYERISCCNYSYRTAAVPLTLSFAADFADMFEVRGKPRPARGKADIPEVESDRVTFRYRGLDDVERTTVISFSAAPQKITQAEAEFALELAPDAHFVLYVEVGSVYAGPSRARYRQAAASARRAMRARARRGARLVSSGRLFNEWIEKSRADLALLTTDLPTGPYPYAGIPWFSTAFGRDAIIASLQMLWIDATLARGVLAFLAETQARETSSFADAEPGKIMHETRKGEMTALKEVPFARYYGGVDTTPLFIILAGAYADRTGELDFIRTIWPALTAAMSWIVHVSDSTPDGFLVYARGAKSGLVNQAWKDSDDSIFHADGRIPHGPIAVVEVQGYAYAAYKAMAGLAERLNDPVAEDYRGRAAKIRANVERKFWMEDLGFYGIAIDGDQALCRILASNPGHLLYMGLPAPERAKKVAECLLSARFDNGWGLRTLAPGQAHFNPMSYHNGSVWPHDTALCAAGIARYGERDGVVKLLNHMFETAVSFGMRLPELFCGFKRAPGEPPIAYPVACLPQAWAAGSVFMLLQACLGVRVDGWRGEIHIDRPALPIGIDRLEVHGIEVHGNCTNLVFQRLGDRVVAFADGPGRVNVPVVTRA